ncbi:hypothetical protein DSO57_1005314 [Entomophthora muscae]|uniref:Uncharacterized protein n=1 Tax=Entomophthora muscae TaxID=34485 RepID=A0ACC2USW1_9FUNG|nr:hypothetical protein DSO57_1005314 [Entomophthora muscae]
MIAPLNPQPNRPMETPTAAETTSTQLFGVLYITLAGMIDTMVPNSGPWSLLGRYISYIIKLAPILWWALPSGPAVFRPKPTNASTYAWLPYTRPQYYNELGAPNAALNQIFWVLQQICYQADMLQNATSRSESKFAPVLSVQNPTNCTEVLVNNLVATDVAGNAANKLAVHSTSVKLQDPKVTCRM